MSELTKKEDALLKKLLAKKLEKPKRAVVNKKVVARLEERLEQDTRAVVTMSPKGVICVFTFESYIFRIENGKELSKEFPKAALKQKEEVAHAEPL